MTDDRVRWTPDSVPGTQAATATAAAETREETTTVATTTLTPAMARLCDEIEQTLAELEAAWQEAEEAAAEASLGRWIGVSMCIAGLQLRLELLRGRAVMLQQAPGSLARWRAELARLRAGQELSPEWEPPGMAGEEPDGDGHDGCDG